MPLVFSYGSLQDERVQIATFGRRLWGEADSLPGHARRAVPVADARREIATVVLDEGDVAGLRVELDEAELARADRYEARDGYRRIAVTLASGRRAWVYVAADAGRDRILFQGNPWPGGHPIDSFAWRARRVGDRVFFDFDLRTLDYDAEASYESRPQPESEGDWESPIVWSNFHRCTLSSDFWHSGGFDVGSVGSVTAATLDGRTFAVDEPPPPDREDNAFYIYLLGHDATAHHAITFRRIADSDRFLIDWRGRIALAYAGETEYRYRFAAVLHDKTLPALPE